MDLRSMNLMAAVYEATETIIDVQSQITNNILTNHTPPGPICSEFIFGNLSTDAQLAIAAYSGKLL